MCFIEIKCYKLRLVSSEHFSLFCLCNNDLRIAIPTGIPSLRKRLLTAVKLSGLLRNVFISVTYVSNAVFLRLFITAIK